MGCEKCMGELQLPPSNVLGFPDPRQFIIKFSALDRFISASVDGNFNFCILGCPNWVISVFASVIGVLLLVMLAIVVFFNRYVLNIVVSANWPLSVAGAVRFVTSSQELFLCFITRNNFQTTIVISQLHLF